jgi:hypothetical protein
MPYEYYFASGFCHNPTAEDPRRGVPEIILYNPTVEASEAVMTLYFTDGEPLTLESVRVKPETNHLVVFPDAKPELLTDCGFFGVKAVCTMPLIVNYINIGVQAVHSPSHFAGGCANFHATKLCREWHFPDGLWLEWNKALDGHIENAPFPFNELEHYYFLNPGRETAEIDMVLRFHDIEDMKLHFTVAGERVFVWENIDKVPFNKGYTVKVNASQPISSSSIRYIYGLGGLDEWGMNVHVTQWAVPGPITE